MALDPRAQEVLAYWFEELDDADWWKKDPALDAAIAARFGALHVEAAAGVLAPWQAEPRGAVALVVLLDQMPRNMFRDTPRAFATDEAAQAVTLAALDAGHEAALAHRERYVLYMPLMHAEDRALQARCLERFTALGSEKALGFARRHAAIIERFGRFPHRNAVMGRASSDEEAAFLNEPGSGF